MKIMNNGLDLIKENNIISAIEKIDKENLKEKDWSIYDLTYNDNIYSPKQVVSMAFSLATGESYNRIFHIEHAIAVCQNNGFKISRKNQIWKLGCNWGKGAPSFYDVLSVKNIAIGVHKYKYQKNDLIIFTEGFTVRAIGKILSHAKNITSNQELAILLREKYQIRNIEDILCYEVDFFELKRQDIYTYELQQGIVNVRKKSIIYLTVNLWEVRTEQDSFNGFIFKSSKNSVKYGLGFPILTLTPDKNENNFELTFYRGPNYQIKIGSINIFQIGQEKPLLEEDFYKLGDEYCVLGETVEYYERLMDIYPTNFGKILDSLRDIAKNKNLRLEFQDYDGLNRTLFSTSESDYILDVYDDLINSKIGDLLHRFSFATRIGEAVIDHEIDFCFNPKDKLTSRFACIVGRNATGKTRYLSNFTNSLTNNEEKGLFHPKRPNFSKVIAASFSFFDKFRFPLQKDTNYEFIGITSEKGIIPEKEFSTLIWTAYQIIAKDKGRMNIWMSAIPSTLEADHFNFEVEELRTIRTKKEFIEKTESIFSSGQNIVFQFLTRLISIIETNSILVFDEPETHLHPNIIGKLLRTLRNILIEFNSNAIIATHSPIILQEIPSKYIRIIDRHSNQPSIYPPTIECFGENLSIISSAIFKVEDEKELYRQKFESLIKEGMSYDQINDLFQNKLSLNAKIYIKSTINL